MTLEVQGDPDKFPELFAMIQRSDYVRITDIRQKDLPPDPWERGFSVGAYSFTKACKNGGRKCVRRFALSIFSLQF